jgi:hypothetical protein
MKKGLLIIVLFSITISMFSQSSIGKIRLRPEYYQTDLKKKDLDSLKNSKTFFVIPSQFSEGYSIEEYKQILEETWTVTPIEVITEREVNKNSKIGNSFIEFKSNGVRTGKASYAFNYFKLSTIYVKSTGKNGQIYSGKKFNGIIFFTASVGARTEMAQMKDTIHGDLLDYRLGYLKNYFQQLNDGIKESKSYDIYDDFIDEEEAKNLKISTLHIPKNILYGFNALTWKEREKSAEQLFENYDYEYEVIDVDELNDKILNDEEPFYYIMYHQKNAHKIITIVEGVTGKIIYRTSKNMSYNIKAKDIKSIMKSIRKL